ncbi:MAG: response regulator [candidate division Zixibacteria bacterium]|nr:response regulator [candidate division Zixibacteria bacterium]
MSQSLHVLLVEDSEDDAQLLIRELRRGGYSPTIQRVETPEEMKTALEKFQWDLVVSDYSMPHFNGLSALYLLRQTGQDLPFILISGTIGESVAVEAMKAGAHDYLMKDKLDRLIPAVQRELKEAQERGARRAAEEFARQSESRFRSLAENIKEVFWITDAQGETIEYISPAYREIWGRDPSEPHQSIYVWLDHIHPEDRDYVTKNLGKQLTGKYDLEYRIVRPDGSLRWIHDRAFPVRDTQGRVTRVVGIAEDISRYKEAESEIRLLQDLTASAAECPDFTSALETVLQKICQATGWDLGEAWIPNPTKDALECSSAFYSSLADLREFYKQSRDIRFSPGQGLPGRVWESKKPQWVKDIPGDENFLRADLAKKFGLRSAMAMPVVANNEVVAVIGFFVRSARDHDERFIQIVSTCAVQLGNIFKTKLAEESQRSLEEQFRQAQKMEAVGQLAGGVAHDFNNLLTLVIGYSESMLHGINPGHPHHKDLEGIRRAAERASGLTRQLLAFSRRQILQPKVLNLNSIIQDAEKMLRRLIGEHIELETELEKPLGKVKVDPGQMEQVLMNLAVNARDAMLQGGMITIKTSNLEVDQKSARTFPDLEIGSYVQLEITDTGCGMDAETKKHIFEPFFTTKELGKGTGLGLSTVYGIVKQSKGHLLVESEPNQGTTFRLFLPLTEEKAGSIPGEQSKTELPQGSETLLLVEDEEELRLLAMDLLVKQGYKVLDACNGLEAISVCQSYSDPIDLIITDMVMPKMGGMALTENLKTLRPGIKVLYISGYTDDLAEQQRLANTGVAFLQKPFTPSALACKIREVLEQKTPVE